MQAPSPAVIGVICIFGMRNGDRIRVFPLKIMQQPQMITVFIDGYYEWLQSNQPGRMEYRHNNMANIGYMDGHAAAMTASAMRPTNGPNVFGFNWDSGITVSCGTDLPLLVPHIGESIFCGCGGCFDDGVAINRENMLTIPEMLTAWTANGAYNCYAEDRLGTLEEGKLADLVVLDRNVLDIDPTQARGTGVALTMSDGRIVHESL